MMKTITEKVGHWIDAAIATHGQGENILWEPGLLPSQQGTPLYTVFVWIPGAVLGTVMNGSFQLPDVLGVTEQDIDDILRQMLEQFRQARSEMLAQSTPAEGPGAPQAGGQRPSGLLIPGR